MPRLAYLALALAACTESGQPVDGGAIQMNDVSILMPLTGAPSSYLAASSHGSRGVLLPEKLYDQVGHIAGSGGIPTPGSGGDARYADLRVVAMRLDPCFASLAPDPHGAGCTAQLRLVFQEVRTVDGVTTAHDSGLHAFYQLSRADLIALAARIASLRAGNSGGERLGGLAPHPIVVEQGMDGDMARGLSALVLEYAGASNLTRVTELSAFNADFSWSFRGFDVDDATAPATTAMIIPTVAAGTTEQTFFRGFVNAGASAVINGQFSPPTTSDDDLVPLADENTAAGLTIEARQAAFDGLVRIDNPTKSSPDTIDCASCHLATPVSRLIAQPMFSLVESDDSFAFHADGRWVLPGEMAATFDGGDTAPFNIHAFSYVETSPAINQRVVDESAAIVAYLNAD
jgi:hypothetical protein